MPLRPVPIINPYPQQCFGRGCLCARLSARISGSAPVMVPGSVATVTIPEGDGGLCGEASSGFRIAAARATIADYRQPEEQVSIRRAIS